MITAGGRNGAPRHDDGGQQQEQHDELIGFKSHLRPTVVPGEAAYLVSQRGVTALLGPHAEVLVPLLDGSRSADAVVREAA
uniref:hypothetical protein n=1 Tax=Streptomyces sp. TRM64462 TaxID=2741726 RepID=UPI00158626D4